MPAKSDPNEKRFAALAAKTLSGKPLEVLVYHCKYECQVHRFVELKNRLTKEFQDLIFVKDFPGWHQHTFEVKINGDLVYSRIKHPDWAYPDHDDLVQILKEIHDGGETRQCKPGEIYNRICRIW